MHGRFSCADRLNGALPFQLLADAVLSLHVAIVAFVIGGLMLVIAGNLLNWRWADALWFQLTHLAAIAIVVAESWFGIVCPLTTLENFLRAKAHVTAYAGDFIKHWLHRILFYDAPPWVFTSTYTVFGLMVAASWWYFPPRHARRR